MFRITLYCDDKKVGELLRGVAGLAIGKPEVEPVVNVETKGGTLKAKTNGSATQMFMNILKERKITEFSSKEGVTVVKSIGMAPSSANYVFKQLIAAGAIKRRGKSSATRYTVTA